MGRWFRFYDDAMHDPKLLKLSDGTFRAWVMLLCVASKTKGTLPSTEDLGFYLRVKPARVAALLAELVGAGLLDKNGSTFSPHNWAGRQYQSDGSAERVKRHREKRAAAGLQSQWTAPKALRQAVYDRDGHRCIYCGSGERLSLDHRTPEIRGGTHDIDNLATACLSCNGAKRDMTETEYRESVTLLKRPQSTEYRTEQKEDKIGDAGASAFTEGSKALASALWKALGHTTPISIPPELAGTDWRAIEWERAGWTVDLIDTEARRVGPGKPLTYYEKVFATSFAKRQAPLPVVEVKEAETITVTHGQPRRRVQETQSLSHIARRHAAEGISFGERPPSPSARLNASIPDVRLLPQGGSERSGNLRGGDGVGTERIPARGDRLCDGPEDGVAEHITVVAERL